MGGLFFIYLITTAFLLALALSRQFARYLKWVNSLNPKAKDIDEERLLLRVRILLAAGSLLCMYAAVSSTIRVTR